MIPITNKSFVCFGEVLFDIFPSLIKIGGAPLNVAVRLAALGNYSSVISRIGSDKLGKEIVNYLKINNVNASCLQIDEELKTGQVLVNLDEKGSATYTINYPSAWDKIEVTHENEQLVSSSDAIVFGSLICRDERSQHTLLQLLQLARFRVFDVNLRQPFYEIKILNKLMQIADFIKFNEEEIFEICELNGESKLSLKECIVYISKFTNTSQICVTRGSNGAVLYINEQFYEHQGYSIKVADTVGAGDSFLAGLLHQLLQNTEPNEALEFSCALGALVAGENGANPSITVSDIVAFIQSNSHT